MPGTPETRFTRADDLDIAYQVIGPAARLDLVFVPGWVSHLEVMWELPEFARFLDRLAAMGRLIVFDKRGTGLVRSRARPAVDSGADARRVPGRHPAVRPGVRAGGGEDDPGRQVRRGSRPR